MLMVGIEEGYFGSLSILENVKKRSGTEIMISIPPLPEESY